MRTRILTHGSRFLELGRRSIYDPPMLYEVIHDRGETPNKCTVASLARRPDFHLIPTKGEGPLGPLTATILLHHQGPCLIDIRDSLGPVTGIACIDCVWRRLDGLMGRIVGTLGGKMPVLARIPDGFVTAYPRRSRLNTDPDGGLATIEAIFAASALLGAWDATLLSDYHFGRRFVELNARRFVELGVSDADDEARWPVVASPTRHAMQRRRDRGRLP